MRVYVHLCLFLLAGHRADAPAHAHSPHAAGGLCSEVSHARNTVGAQSLVHGHGRSVGMCVCVCGGSEQGTCETDRQTERWRQPDLLPMLSNYFLIVRKLQHSHLHIKTLLLNSKNGLFTAIQNKIKINITPNFRAWPIMRVMNDKNIRNSIVLLFSLSQRMHAFSHV